MQPSAYKINGKRVCNPTGWAYSIKLDGLKGRWIQGKFTTRSGIKLNPPEWFIKLLPEFDIEGELYLGANTFHKTASLRKDSRIREDDSWDSVQFHIFDLIDYTKTWIERQKFLKTWHDNLPEDTKQKIFLVTWKKIKSIEHLESKYEEIIKKGGEGVIIANFQGKYENGHVTQILKYKAKKDSEAVIVDYFTDYTGKLLSSFIVNPIVDGKVNKKLTFKVGTGLKQKERKDFKDNYPVGSIISYTYEVESSSGKPRTPIFKGLRVDMKV